MSVPNLSSAQKVTPQIICGPVHQQNKTALDWSWQGPVAFGCNRHVIVVDPRTSQNLQTLEGHSSNVIKVKWSHQLYHATLASPYILRLASVDSNGQCIVWDVGQATHLSNFSVANRSLVDMQWLTTNDTCRDLLIVLTAPGTLTIWNADTGTKISRFTFVETISAFTFNPFKTEQLVLLSSECFIFINDFSPSKNPTNNSKKLYMNIPQQQIGGGGRGWSRDAPRRLLSSDNIRNEDSLTLVDCIQTTFSPIERNHLFLLYPREILIIDVEIMQAVGSVYLDRISTSFIQIFPCQQRDALYCLHENGSVSFRVRQPLELPQNLTLTVADFRDFVDVVYDLHYQTEPQRISKSVKPYSFAVCPTTELNVAVLTSEGKLLFWETGFEIVGIHGERVPEDEGYQVLTLISALPAKSGEERLIGEESKGLRLSDSISPHWFTPVDDPETYSLLTVYMVLTNVYYGLASSLTTLKMCPPLTTKNLNFYKPMVAVGNGGGGIQILNLSTRQLQQEITVHTCPIRGIEWMTHNIILTYAYPPANSSGLVRNELAAVYLDTGHVIHLKKGETSYQQPIISVRISPHKNYFAVNYRDSPLEFYNAKNFTYMRKLESKPSTFSIIEWANANSFPSFVSKTRSHASPEVSENEIESQLLAQEAKTSTTGSSEKEIISLVDIDSNIHHIIVDRGGFQLGPKKSHNFTLKGPTGMGWKGDIIMVGDSEGTLAIWEVGSSSLRYMETPKAVIRKVKFGPGKGNRRSLILYSNRLDIRDIFEDSVLGQFKWNKSDISIDDVDWCSSDKLICLMSDGSIKVTDVKFIYSATAYNSTSYHVPVFSPYITLPQSTFRFKCILQHQPWRIDYSLDYSDLDKLVPIEKGVSILLETLPETFREKLINASLGTPERSLIAAILLGDEGEIQFWNVALYHMTREKKRLQDPRYRHYQYSSSPPTPETDLFQPDLKATTNITSNLRHSLEDILNDDSISTNGVAHDTNLMTWKVIPPLDFCHDLYMDQDIYKRYQLHKILCHDSRRHTTEQTRRCAESLLFLGQTDRAVQLLLETDSASSDYYPDALKACLAATIRSSGASQSTIKLVATNLIANNKLLEGAQLLSLIDKGLDACRYLQTYGKWYLSVWLAKSTLSEKEAREVFLRWVENLNSSSVNQKSKAVLVLLSLGKFYKVLELLYSMRYFDLAAVFGECCLECGLIRRNKDTSSLIEAVFLEYARLLETLGMNRAMRYYCNLAGENGRLLLEEHNSPQGKTL